MKERPILFSGPMVKAILGGQKTQTRRSIKNLPCQCDCFTPKEMSATTPEGWQIEGSSGRWWCECCTSNEDAVNCPFGMPGDRLWVRENWSPDAVTMYPCPNVWYAASDDLCSDGVHSCPPEHRGRYADCLACWESRNQKFRWRPSIHMPRHLSRITLEIVNVRVERLNDISHNDAIHEGIETISPRTDDKVGFIWKDYAGYASEPHIGWDLPIDSFHSLWESINGPDSWGKNPWVWVVEFKRIKP